MKQFQLLIFLISALFALQTAVAQAFQPGVPDNKSNSNTQAPSLNTASTQQSEKAVAGAWNNKLQNTGKRLLFMENLGQLTDTKGNAVPDILFSAGNGSTKIYITGNALYYQFKRWQYPAGYDRQKLDGLKDKKERQQLEQQITQSTQRFGVLLQGSNPHPVVRKEKMDGYSENYYLPGCPQGITGVHGYEKIVFENVYNGIDWVVYSKGDKMEYDFIVHAGADPASIKMKVDDADGYKITAAGQLQIETRLGGITEKAPVTYDGHGNIIATRFVKSADGTIGFALKSSPGQTLRIDPEIAWSTYYGGTGDDYGNSTAVDSKGNVYLAGTTSSTSSIALTGYQNAAGGGYDAFLVKFDQNGNRLWATYYGGASDDYGTACTVDTSGNVYLAGYTYSPAGIASAGFQNSFGGILDAFLAKFNAGGSRVWGTYYGGLAEDEAASCSVDASGNVYLAGYTGSTGSIASGGFQNTFGGAGYYDAFLVKFNPAGNRLWATYYGGAGDDLGSSCAVDRNGNVYMAGYTSSTAGIASAGFQNTFTPGGYYDAFLVKFNGSGARLWASYFGGEGNDLSSSCALDPVGDVYMAGYTNSTTGIASGGFQSSIGAAGYYDAFLVKFNTGGARLWSTYYGGAGVDYGNSVAVDAGNSVYLAGSTSSTAGIASGGFQNTYTGGTDAFLVKFAPGGARLWATYYGGAGADIANSCVVKGSDSVCLAGYTSSPGGIASGGLQNTFGGGTYDAFLAKTNAACIASIKIVITPGVPICQGTKATFSSGSLNAGPAPAYQWVKNGVNVGTSSAYYTDSTLNNGDSVYAVLTSDASCALTKTATSNVLKVSVNAKVTPSVSLRALAPDTICAGTNVLFIASVSNAGTSPSYQWVKNGVNVGSNPKDPEYTDSQLKNGDSVKVYLTSYATCVTTNTAVSNTLKFAVEAAKPVAPVLTGPFTAAPGQTGIGFKVPGVPGAAYEWAVSPGNTITTGQGTDSITVSWGTKTGAVVIKETNACGTSGTSTQQVYITAIPAGLAGLKYVPEEDGTKVLLYPNPAADAANLQISGFKNNMVVTVTDITGKTVLRQDNVTNGICTLPLNKLAQGIYVVTIADGKYIRTVKLVKAK